MSNSLVLFGANHTCAQSPSQFHQWGIKKQVPKDEYFLCTFWEGFHQQVLLAQQGEAQYSRLAGHGVTLCR